MNPASWIAAAVLALFLLRWTEYFFLRTQGTPGDARGRWTTAAVLAAGSVAYLGAAAEAVWHPWVPLWPLTAAGAALWLGRLGLKVWAVRTLGGAWSTGTGSAGGCGLVTTGPYAWVRHPIYVCNMLDPLSIAAVAAAPIAAAWSVVVIWPLVWARLSIEESNLRERFGGSYDAYRKRVRALLPIPSIRGDRTDHPVNPSGMN